MWTAAPPAGSGRSEPRSARRRDPLRGGSFGGTIRELATSPARLGEAVLIVFPAIAIGAVMLVLAARTPTLGFGRSLLRAILLAGLFVVVTTELLSLVDLLSTPALAIGWAFAALTSGWIAYGEISRRALPPWPRLPADVAGKALAGGIAVILLVTAIVAWATPPQTWDSLNYHMPRVAHWAENRSVRPFATGIETQNSRTPGAEFAVLHAYLLGRSDRWVNFVSWLAVAGGMVCVFVLARQAGVGRDGRRLALAYFASMPMAIIQASSTMTDAVAALWVAIAAVEIGGVPDDERSWRNAVWAGLAAALAILTKPTAIPFLVPLAVWAAFVLGRRLGLGRTLLAGAGVTCLVAVVNGPHWIRSTALYGDPISGGDQAGVHANQLRSLPGQISNVVRNFALHLGTPSPYVNFAITSSILRLHQVMGVNPNDPRTTAHGLFRIDEPTTQEDQAGNPAQAYLALGALVLLGFRWRSLKSLLPLAFVSLAGFWLFATLFKWQIFGARYHVIFFLLAAPVVAGALGVWARPRVLQGLSLVLVGLSLPWLMSIRSRPLIPNAAETRVPVAEQSLVGSVLAEPRDRLLLANGLYLLRPYHEIADLIQEGTCAEIGLALFGNSAEYPLWAFLGFPNTSSHIEWIVEGTPSARLLPPEFLPCAVICEGCEEDAAFRGLPPVYRRGGLTLFLREGSEPAP